MCTRMKILRHWDNEVDKKYIFGQHSNMKYVGSKVIFVGFICLALGFGIGVFFTNYFLVKQSTELRRGNFELFNRANASISGMITKIDKNVATVKSAQGIGNYTVSTQVNVFMLRPGTKQATASADLNVGLLNKNAMIELAYQNGHFEIISISLIPENKVTPTPPQVKK